MLNATVPDHPTSVGSSCGSSMQNEMGQRYVLPERGTFTFWLHAQCWKVMSYNGQRLTAEELVASIYSKTNLPCALGLETSLWDSVSSFHEGGGWDRSSHSSSLT